MSVARAASEFPGAVHEAESCWCDTGRWPAWVNGLERVIQTDGAWPQEGAVVRWESGPAGRGRVTERVLSYEPLASLTLRVEDDSISGTQSVSFAPSGERVAVECRLDYQIKKRSIFTPVIDLLFIRRAMEVSLAATLAGFGAELAERRTAAKPR